MKDTKTKKRGLAAIFRLCPARHILILASGLAILLHLLTRDNKSLMSLVSLKFVRPVHAFLARVSAFVPFSLAEILVLLFAAGVLAYLLMALFGLVKAERKPEKVYIISITLLSIVLFVYALFCLLWGVYYYGESFADNMGLRDEAVSVGQLEAVTVYFAGLANAYCDQVPRDENGFCAIDRDLVLARSDRIYENAERLFPTLEGPDVRAKGIKVSKLLSFMDTTGFFFPFTGEANVNTHFPSSLFPATVAHELAHQRGIAQEEQANFIAVLASLESGDAEFCYSAALLAYVHLGNALHGADYEAWKEVFSSLDERVVRDIALENHYWAQFESPVQDISNAVYEGFLQSYDQTLGLSSYGACVDLLVNYYYEKAIAFDR